MERLTDTCWMNFDPWECCGQDNYCKRDSREVGGCRNGCIVPKLYVRLAKYEDTGLTPEEIAVQNSPNIPLTLDDLKQMDGEPVWAVETQDNCSTKREWVIISTSLERAAGNELWLVFESYGTQWLAYRNKQKEDVHD